MVLVVEISLSLSGSAVRAVKGQILQGNDLPRSSCNIGFALLININLAINLETIYIVHIWCKCFTLQSHDVQREIMALAFGYKELLKP